MKKVKADPVDHLLANEMLAFITEESREMKEKEKARKKMHLNANSI